jgi:catechol 2,3-dioxygenase-like lactoylglutathione lyase family enzyme
MNRYRWIAPAVLIIGLPVWAQPKRPPIVGVAHVSLKVRSLAEARKFYGQGLGYSEVFQAGPSTYFKVNDHQYIQVTPGLQDDAEDRLLHVAFETTDIHGLRDYLASKGVAVAEKVAPNAEGDLGVTVYDPEGREIEFVEYTRGSLSSVNFGKAMGEARISERIIHAGFIVQDRAAEDRFWKDILEFRETWHGGMRDDRTDWIDMRVPEGTDWLEYMLNQPHPSARTRGVMNHLALGVPSADKAYQRLKTRTITMNEQPKIGRDGKWQLNLYDPDLTRVELMEPVPVEKPCCSEFVK